MTNPSDRPSRYSIEGLLNGSAQPLPDYDADSLRALGRSIGKSDPLIDPVSVSSDGILLDGHQRLKAMLAQGRKFIDASDVHIVEQANRDNAMEFAVMLNVQRRHLSVEQKADLARRLQAERHWSQATIARLFGVSRPAVTQWLRKTATEDSPAEPDYVVGEDEKVYEPKRRSARREQLNPWRPDGYAYKALGKARKVLESESVGGLNALHLARLQAEVEDTVAACEGILDQIADETQPGAAESR